MGVPLAFRPERFLIRMRIPSFSILRLFWVVTACALVLAVILYCTQEYRRRLAVRIELKEMGASWVGFNSENNTSILFNQNLRSDRLKKYAGKIASAENKMFSVSDQHLKNLASLKSLSSLLFVSTDLEDTDLGLLQEFEEIGYLVFWKSALTDSQIEGLAELKNVAQISFISVDVAPAKLEALRAALPETKVILAN